MLCCFCWRRTMNRLGRRRYSGFTFGTLSWNCITICNICGSAEHQWKCCWLVTAVYTAVKRTDHVWSSSQFFFALIFHNILLIITTFCAWETVSFIIIIIPVTNKNEQYEMTILHGSNLSEYLNYNVFCNIFNIWVIPENIHFLPQTACTY